ncbi:MAG: tRNA epoxyqueuosine(34) reductase QueG [Acidobacteriota bacterium]|nr:MAG: tRNA epoxyqueuosine(34) reductase QueG [Acidobacteriota bacterium]
MTGIELKQAITAKARAVGFEKVGVTRARLDEEAPRLDEWLRRGYHGEMRWMERDPGRRTDASRNLANAHTLVCCALNYNQGPLSSPSRARHGVISSYARGDDYHLVLESKLKEVADFIETTCAVTTKLYVDTGPVLEKSYAVAAGLGWMGKHSNLLSRDGSSWFFLGEILIPLELPVDAPTGDHCGTCTRCIDACPTRAIVEPYVVDSRLCISYLTIELRGSIPRELRRLIGDRIYGCDDCQDVCPWNRFAKKSEEAKFFPREPLGSMDLIAMLRMSRESFTAATRRSAIRRARYPGFLRNVAVALGNSDDPRAVPALVEALAHEEPLVRAHAGWALGQLGDARAKKPLAARAQREETESIREEIAWALQRLDTHLG